MVLKLDPRFPLVWRSPDSIQLGVDAPLVVIDGVTSAQERLVAALVAGVGRSGLDMIARAAAAEPGEVDRLLETVSPAMERTASAPAPAISIDGSGPTADRIRALIGDTVGTDFAVVVAHHVIAPELHGRWLRRDIPHLPIVFGDSVVRIGPVVEPGTGPCLYCLELHRTDADPAWPAIATQLLGRTAMTESPLVASEVAAIAARIVLARIAAGRYGRATSIELQVATGDRASKTWTRHPDCGCADVSAVVSAVPRESARASAPPSDPIRSSTTTGAVPVSPA